MHEQIAVHPVILSKSVFYELVCSSGLSHRPDSNGPQHIVTLLPTRFIYQPNENGQTVVIVILKKPDLVDLNNVAVNGEPRNVRGLIPQKFYASYVWCLRATTFWFCKSRVNRKIRSLNLPFLATAYQCQWTRPNCTILKYRWEKYRERAADKRSLSAWHVWIKRAYVRRWNFYLVTDKWYTRQCQIIWLWRKSTNSGWFDLSRTDEERKGTVWQLRVSRWRMEVCYSLITAEKPGSRGVCCESLPWAG